MCDTNYLRTLQGICKLSEILLMVVAMILLRDISTGYRFLLYMMSVACLIPTFIFFVVFMVRVPAKVRYPWLFVEHLLNLLMFATYFGASLIAVGATKSTTEHNVGSLLVVAVALLYYISAVVSFRDFRKEHDRNPKW